MTSDKNHKDDLLRSRSFQAALRHSHPQVAGLDIRFLLASFSYAHPDCGVGDFGLPGGRTCTRAKADETGSLRDE